MFAWLPLLLLLVILFLSVWQRIKYFRKEIVDNQLKASPLSLAIQELISIAGSIYLSLIMLVSFLKLNLPETIFFFDFSIDPLAFLAIALAIIQPFFLALYHKLKKLFSI